MANNQLLASDSFTSGSLAAGWSATSDSTAKVSVVLGSPNVTEPGGLSANYGQYWSGLTWPNDQISEVTSNLLTAESLTITALIVRQQVGVRTRYEADIYNGAAYIYRIVAGTVTQIGSTVTGLTFAAGDVWTFAAIGSAITLYQNGKRLFVVGDASITGGSPGFIQYTTTNVTHTQVSAWRGYSAVQQDGIWTKQGIVVAPIAGDMMDGIQCHSQIIYEGNAQILSGTVYKMWFDNFVNVYYAESLDGKSWTRRATPVVSGFSNSCVIKNGSTYFLYGQVTEGTSPVECYTSPDGITWTLQNSSCIALGSGTWDDSNIYPFFAITVQAGTFYGYYGGLNGTLSTTPFSLGLATSPDGITWTKHTGNPIITGKGNACGFISAGGVFYIWLQGNQPGLGNPTAPLFDPAESVRYQSTDLINWSNPTHSTHNSQMFESLNANTGYCTGGYLIDVGGKAYNYTTVGVGDAVKPVVGQTELLIGPAPIASIVKFPEDGAQQIATDPFTSGSGNLSANWTTPTGGTALQIVSGPYVEPTATSTVCQAVYTGASFGASQYSEITLHALTGTLAQSLVWPTVRSSTTALTNYEGLIASPSGTSDAAAAIYKRVAGIRTQIGPTATIDPVVGDVFRLSVVTGSDGFPVLSLFQNGFLILQVQDSSSTPITTGNPGIQAFSSVAIADAQIASWAGGNANVIPTYSIGWSPVDCRDFGTFPNTAVLQNSGAEFYTGQTSSNPALPPTDSNPTFPATDSRATIPQNSRTDPSL